MQSIFTRLHTYRPRPDRNPEEDFFTEAFVGVMERNSKALVFLLTNLLEVKELEGLSLTDDEQTSLNISSQISYTASDGSINRPDIIIKGSDSNKQEFVICIESKIGSVGSDNQLRSYAQQIQKEYSNCKLYLFYITRYSEKRNETNIIGSSEVNFAQYRWYEVYKYLHNYSSKNDPLLNELIKFMEDKRIMAKLSLSDLATTMNACVINKVYVEILDDVWASSELIKTIYNHETKDGTSRTYNDISTISRYTPYVTDDKIQVFLGFGFNLDHPIVKREIENSSTEFPLLFISICTAKESKKERSNIIDKLRKFEKIKALENSGWQWENKKENSWHILTKAIPLDGISKHNNFVEFFIGKFQEELSVLNVALKELL